MRFPEEVGQVGSVDESTGAGLGTGSPTGMAAVKAWAGDPGARRAAGLPPELIRIRFEELTADLAATDGAALGRGDTGHPAVSLSALMTAMGVPDDLAQELTRATVAVATVARYGVLPAGTSSALLAPPDPAGATPLGEDALFSPQVSATVPAVDDGSRAAVA